MYPMRYHIYTHLLEEFCLLNSSHYLYDKNKLSSHIPVISPQQKLAEFLPTGKIHHITKHGFAC